MESGTKSDRATPLRNADLVVAFNGPSGMNVANRGVRDLLEMSPPDDWQLVAAEADWIGSKRLR